MNSRTTFRDTDKGLKAILAHNKELSEACVLVGLPGRSSPREKDSPMTVATLGVIHEFGSPANGIPARPFMAQTYQKHGKAAFSYMVRMARVVAEGKMDARTALNRVGVFYTGRVKDTLRNGTFVPNAPATIARKGSSKPLIDTGLMRASVTHVIAPPNAKGAI